MPIISLYGTDGSGKSTIANEMAQAAADSTEAVVMGGGSYEKWLTPELAHDLMGSRHCFDETPGTADEFTRLYEDIAVVCYGLARRLANEGRLVIIDSDPYLKRIVWGTLSQEDEDALHYVQRFDEYIADFLGADAAPTVIAGINVSSESSTSPEHVLARLQQRGNNSDHDPTDIEQMQTLDQNIRRIWREIKGASRGKSSSAALNRRLGKAVVDELENPQCSPERLRSQTRQLAGYLISCYTDKNLISSTAVDNFK